MRRNRYLNTKRGPFIHMLDELINKRMRKKSSIEKYAKIFKMPFRTLRSVLLLQRRCPLWLINHFSISFKIDKEVIGIAFGYQPIDWVHFCRYYPQAARIEMVKILKKYQYRKEEDCWKNRRLVPGLGMTTNDLKLQTEIGQMSGTPQLRIPEISIFDGPEVGRKKVSFF